MTVSLDAFLPEVLPECPGVPHPVAINAIRNACFDFCQGSLWWNEWQAAVNYTAGDASYTLTSPVDTLVAGVLCLNLDEKTVVYPAADEGVAGAIPDYGTRQAPIRGFIQPALEIVQLVPVPQEAGYFLPKVAYAPTRTATTIAAKVFSLKLEAIKHGALWKLKAMPNQAWSDPAEALDREQRFRRAIHDAIVERNKGNSRATLRVQPRRFA